MEIATNCTRKFCQIRKGYMLTCASHEARICNTPRKPKKHWLFGERKINNNKSYNFKVGDQFENGVGYPVIIFGFEYWTFKDINIVGIRNNMVAPGSATKTKGSCSAPLPPPHRYSMAESYTSLLPQSSDDLVSAQHHWLRPRISGVPRNRTGRLKVQNKRQICPPP